MTPPADCAVPCPPLLRPAAIRQLYAELPSEQQSGFVAAIERLDPRSEAEWASLFVVPQEVDARGAPGAGGDDARLAACGWVQRLPGNSAAVWLGRPGSDASLAVLRAARSWLASHDVALAQFQLAEADAAAAARYAEAGFPLLADLDYLFADAQRPREEHLARLCSAAIPNSSLRVAACPPRDMELFAKIVEQTYCDSLDCPLLDGVRRIEDVLEGYRAQGRPMPDQWSLARDEAGEIVGTLILADHPEAEVWELVYMGIVPAARGRGYGRQLARHAIRSAAQAGAERVVLAVDANNGPARRAYEQSGFRLWQRRRVFAHCGVRADAFSAAREGGADCAE